jgi:hypothetical protein
MGRGEAEPALGQPENCIEINVCVREKTMHIFPQT